MSKYIYVKQHDASDCAAACLASISMYYGRETTITKLRDILGTDIKGTNVNGVVTGASNLGFEAKAVRLSLDSLMTEEITLPLIAHTITDYGLSHFVVIYKIKKDKLYINDPSNKNKVITKDEFSKAYDGVVILLKPNDEFVAGKVKEKGMFKRFIKLLSPHKKYFIWAIIGSLILTILGIVSNYFNKILIDDILPYNLKNQLTVFALGFLAVSVVNIMLGAVRTHILLRLSIKIDIPLTLGYYNHIFSLPMSFFGSRKTGDILTRFSDAQTIKNVFTGIALSILIDLVMILVVGVVLFLMSPKLFAIVIISTIINVVLVYIFKKPYKEINLTQMEQGAKLNSSVIESLRGIETVKSNSIETDVMEKIENNYIDTVKTGYRVGVLSNVQQSSSGLIGTVINIVMLWVGATAVMGGDLTLGALMTFTSMAGMFMDPIGRMVGLQLQIQESQIAMKRLSEIFDVKKEQEDKKQTIDNLKGNIKFDNVTFSYGTRAPVLKNISFNINKGDRVAIVGESGSGKTTIAKLILGLWKPKAGDILLDGIKVNEIDYESLRSKVAYVNQNVELFSGSVAENIKIINPNVSREDINIALRLADASFVNNLPAGIDTYLEEAGANLSGGERQRLALARSLSKSFDLLILDEATSNLDFVSEQKIYENILNSNFKGTIVFIAHRLSSIKYSDNILVMDKGKLVESGTHDELLNNNGVYKKLWNSQNSDINLNKNKEITKNEEIVEGSEITYE